MLRQQRPPDHVTLQVQSEPCQARALGGVEKPVSEPFEYAIRSVRGTVLVRWLSRFCVGLMPLLEKSYVSRSDWTKAALMITGLRYDTSVRWLELSDE